MCPLAPLLNRRLGYRRLLDEPEGVNFVPLPLMSDAQRKAFEEAPFGVGVWPEVGSRAGQRLVITPEGNTAAGWLDVQEGRYRYLVTLDDGVTVRMARSR